MGSEAVENQYSSPGPDSICFLFRFLIRSELYSQQHSTRLAAGCLWYIGENGSIFKFFICLWSWCRIATIFTFGDNVWARAQVGNFKYSLVLLVVLHACRAPSCECSSDAHTPFTTTPGGSEMSACGRCDVIVIFCFRHIYISLPS